MYTENGALVLQADEGGTGALAILNGSCYWTDYSAKAELSIEAGDNGYLVGRYVDDSNYVFLEVDGKSVTLAQKVGGENTILATADYAMLEGHYILLLSFNGDTVSCGVDDTIDFGPMAIDPSLARGGMGFKAWDMREGLVRVSIWNVAVMFEPG